MYRFKASKYKNAAPVIAKKEECVTDISAEAPITFGNHAAASAKLVAFCVGSAGGGKLMVLGVDAKGRFGNGPTLNAHSDSITSLEFSPFNHCRLATAAADNTVKIWDLPPEGIAEEYTDDPILKLSGFTSRPECIAFNPVADEILAVACGSKLLIYNTGNGEEVFEIDVGHNVIQCISWKKDGSLIAATTKDCRLLIVDPRNSKDVQDVKAHGNHKESRVVWLGETTKVLTTGFSTSRDKQAAVWDVGGGKPDEMQTEDFGTGTGVLMPFYDEDTGMVFLSAKGDSNVTFLEFFNDKDPPLKLAMQQLLQNQVKGMCLIPKLGVEAAECEVNRLYQLSQKMLIPIPWKVPRKSLREFPADLFPDTASDEPALTAEQWLSGQNSPRKKTSLEPSKRKDLRLGGGDTTVGAQKSVPVVTKDPPVAAEEKPKPSTRAPTPPKEESKPEPPPAVSPSKTKYKPFTGVRKSIFRHWTCTAGHPSRHVTNVEPVSLSVLPSSDVLRCSELYAAVPLKGAGGQVCIIELSKPGRMNDSNSLTLQNSKAVTDMQWNPFNPSELVVALESGDVKVWTIPPSKCGEELNEPDLIFSGHEAKPIVLCYHPLAENVIASGEVDPRIIIWNTATGEKYFELSCGSGEVMSIAWSIDGKYLASSSKDKNLRIFEPRKSEEAVQVGPGPAGSRTSRLAWTCNDKFLAVSGFDSASLRVVSLYSTTDLASGVISEEEFPTSPAVLAVHYDQDSSTLLLAGKGDTTMYSLEVSESEPPHLFRIATYSSNSPFQGVSFLTKKGIDVKKVEFAQAWSLSKITLHPLSFTVPRVKMEYFQDDIFPPTSVTWEKTLSASDWLKGTNKAPRKLDLKPKGMKSLSEAPPDEVKPKKYASYDPGTYKTDEQKKEELLEAMSNKLDLDKQLEQDTMEGVDEDEWDDY